MKRLNLVLALSLLVAIGCGKKEEESEPSINSINSSAEAGITAVSGVIDDQAGSTFAASTKPSPYHYAEKLFHLALPQAYAVSCARAVDQSCSSGVRSVSFSSCDLPRGAQFSGQITLTYSDSGCSMASTGNSVTRTYDYDISGPYGNSVLAVTSEGGGGRLTKTAGGWNLEILGKRKILTWRGREIMNHSISTPSPIQITGGLTRASRVVNSGSFQVVHNLAGYTATYVPNNLTYSGTCCHPISGSMSVTYTGSVTGSGSITFNGCGQGTLIKDGVSQDLELNYCE